MTALQAFVAFDLGASRARVMLGQMDGDRLQLSEIHRFINNPVRLPDGYHWDVLYLWQNIKDGLRLAVRQQKSALVSLGVDAWGADFALLDKSGGLIFNPYYSMDKRTEGMPAEAFRRVSREAIYEQTGVQFIRFNSLYQLLALVSRQSPALRDAQTFLMLPDLFNFWLSGSALCEFTEASTSQCLDIRKQVWSVPLLERMGIPIQIFPPIIQPGTPLGALLKGVADETGAAPISVIAPACHDTASAVAAIPAEGPDIAWITSGTWSIMGVDVKTPVITTQARLANLANEGGVNRTYRLSKNVAAMWLIQECRRTWANSGEDLSYAKLAELGAAAEPLLAVIDPDAQEFLTPGDMPERIRAYCKKTGQAVPETRGVIVRVILEGIALKYRWILELLEGILGRSLNTIHIVGGGTQNRLLSQLTADATNRLVKSGPLEATALGNILMQMQALGHIHSLGEGRDLIRRSFPLETFEPNHTSRWDAAYGRLLNLL